MAHEPTARQSLETSKRVNALIGIDVGTSAVKGVLFDVRLRPLERAAVPVATRVPVAGRAEQDADTVVAAVARVLRRLLRRGRRFEIAGIGLCVHRSSLVVMDGESGRFDSPIVLWSDRRAAATAQRLAATAAGRRVVARTGLPLLPYLFGVRARHLLDHARPRITDRSGLRLTTVDGALLHRLTGGAAYATDPSLTARTLLADPRTGEWQDDLLRALRVPRALLPPVVATVGDRGVTRAGSLRIADGIAIGASLADQSAAVIGLTAPLRGATTLIFGTGLFAARCGERAAPRRGVFPLVLATHGRRAWRGGEANDPSTGASFAMFRRLLGCGTDAALTRLAARAAQDGAEIVVPAVTGLGAPYLAPLAQAAIVGLSAGSGKAELARALVAGVAARAAELLAALGGGDGAVIAAGGGSASALLLQTVADLSGREVLRAAETEAGARGAALLAGVGVGLFEDVESAPARPPASARFTPRLSGAERREKLRRFTAVASWIAGAGAPP